MKLILKNLKQVEFEIFIESEKITVKEFKKEIEELYSFDSEQIKLIYNGKILENDKMLEEYEIKEGNHIIMMNMKTKTVKKENQSNPIEYQEKPKQIKSQIDPKNKQNISQILSDNWTIQVNSLVDMGFERSQVEAAVKASNGRIDLAIEYLNNGIPDNKLNNNIRNNNMQRQRNKDDITKELMKQAGVIKMLCKDNKYRIFEILNNIKQNDPGLMKLISDYRDDFKNYLDSPITEEDKQNYEKIEAQADKIQQERKEKREKAKKEKEEKEKKEKEEKEEKEKKEKKEKEEKEKEKKEDKNEEKKVDEKDSNNKNEEEIIKEEKNKNNMEEEKKDNKENKEDKESNVPRDMEDKKEVKDDNKNNNNEPKKDDNLGIEEKNKDIEENNNKIKQINSENKDENENKIEVMEEKKEEKKELDEDNKKEEEKDIENKDKETTNNKIENSGDNPVINQLTEEEKETVNRIKSLCNFSFQTVAEAFIACNKNEELTANFLFENM